MKNSFFVKESTLEVIRLFSIKNSSFLYSTKIDLPGELKIRGHKKVFQSIILQLLERAKLAYKEKLFNMIILTTAKIENDSKFSINVTYSGPGFSLLEKTLISRASLIFRDNHKNFQVCQISKTLKNNFKAQLRIISKKDKGATLKCIFPF